MVLVLTKYPLQYVMHNTNQSGRLSKWTVELNDHDIKYKIWSSEKSQVLDEFIIKLSLELEQDMFSPQ